MTTKHVGELIREARESVNISQRDLVFEINTFGNSDTGTVSRRHLSNVELGNSNISMTKLNLITAALIAFGAK